MHIIFYIGLLTGVAVMVSLAIHKMTNIMQLILARQDAMYEVVKALVEKIIDAEKKTDDSDTTANIDRTFMH